MRMYEDNKEILNGVKFLKTSKLLKIFSSNKVIVKVENFIIM